MKRPIVVVTLLTSTVAIGIALVQVRTADIQNIREYGAVCDGMTDDTAAIQAALDAGAGRAVYVPEAASACLISRPLRVPSHTRLYGDGWNSRLRAIANFGDRELVGNATTAPATEAERDAGIRIEQLAIDGNQAENGPAKEHSPCILLRAVVDAHVEGVRCTNPKGDGVQLGAPSAATGVRPLRNTVRHNVITGARRNGVSVTEGEQISVDRNAITASALHGIDLEANNGRSLIRDVTITRNVITASGTSNYSYGIAVTGGQTLAENILVSRNIIDATTGGGIGFRLVTQLTVERNLIRRPTTRGIALIGGGDVPPSAVSIDRNVIHASALQGIALASTAALVITGNHVVGSGSYSLQVDDAVGATIQGNRLTRGALDGLLLTDVSQSTVTDNTAEGHRGNGIRLLGRAEGAAHNTVAANVSQENGGWGITEGGVGTDYNLIVHNDVRGNVAGGVHQSGAHSVVADNLGDE